MKKLTIVYIIAFIIISLFCSNFILSQNKDNNSLSNASVIKINTYHDIIPIVDKEEEPNIDTTPNNSFKPSLSDKNSSTNNNPENIKPDNNNSNISKPTNLSVDEIIADMSIEEKIGQMIIIDYRKPNMDKTLKNILTTVKPGGFIFFSENFQNNTQAKNLINNIKNTASIPLFLSIDQEGGRVQRLKNLAGAKITTIPSMAEIGASKDTNKAYNMGEIIGTDLAKYGINMNFAPVLDVYSNPNNKVIGDRSFGQDPYLVSKMGIALGNGLKKKNVIPVYKHFPGHGNIETDSHYNLPIVNKTKEELLNLDLIPFINAINNNAEVIMIGHLAVPSITGDNTPASISKTLVTDFLKKELGYKNLVITDALNMQALTKNYSSKNICINAINAGVDILLMPENPVNAINYIKEAIKNGTISEEKINTSVKKILNLKRKYKII